MFIICCACRLPPCAANCSCRIALIIFCTGLAAPPPTSNRFPRGAAVPGAVAPGARSAVLVDAGLVGLVAGVVGAVVDVAGVVSVGFCGLPSIGEAEGSPLGPAKLPSVEGASVISAEPNAGGSVPPVIPNGDVIPAGLNGSVVAPGIAGAAGAAPTLNASVGTLPPGAEKSSLAPPVTGSAISVKS